jgi:hypothetical protein
MSVTFIDASSSSNATKGFGLMKEMWWTSAGDTLSTADIASQVRVAK